MKHTYFIARPSQRRMLKQEQLSQGSKHQSPLHPGQHVRIQNQKQNKQWDQAGVVLEALPYDAYLISVNGSRTVTKRNRQFLRAYTPVEEDYAIQKPKPVAPLKVLHPARPYVPPTLPLPPPISPQLTPTKEPTQPEEQHSTTPLPQTPARNSVPPQQLPHMDHDYCRPPSQGQHFPPAQQNTDPGTPVMSTLYNLNALNSTMCSPMTYMIPPTPCLSMTPQIPGGQIFFPSPTVPQHNSPVPLPTTWMIPRQVQQPIMSMNTVMSGINTIQ